MKPLRIAILTAWNDRYAPIADITLPIMSAYAKKHGYGLHYGEYHEDPERLSTYGDRGKIGLYLTFYDDHDILMWLDIDTLVMNHDIRIEDRLGDRPFLWTYDCNGPCSGFWIARTDYRVKMMFNKVRNEAALGRGCLAEMKDDPKRMVVQYEPYGTSDQMMMRQLMWLPPYHYSLQHCVSCKEAGHCFDYRILKWPESYDAIGHYEDGDWLYTLPSVPLEERTRLLKRKAQDLYARDPSSHDGGLPDPDALLEALRQSTATAT